MLDAFMRSAEFVMAMLLPLLKRPWSMNVMPASDMRPVPRPESCSSSISLSFSSMFTFFSSIFFVLKPLNQSLMVNYLRNFWMCLV